ncbi:MAG: porin family protein [Cyclobacteriaceae bacterium]
MQKTNLRHQLYLHGYKVAVFSLLFVLFSADVQAQRGANNSENMPNYDKRWLHYGFSMGLHSSGYRLQYADSFAGMDSLHSVMPDYSYGFSLGLIANFRLLEYLDLRIMPEVVFYENRVNYNFIQNGQSVVDQQLVEATFVEFPLLFKYKSKRWGNTRMYLVGGIEPGFEATGKKEDQDADDRLLVRGSNLSLQAGFGLDVYFPLFKFSPELRFSRGIVNVKNERENPYGAPIQQLTTNTVTLYLLFE